MLKIKTFRKICAGDSSFDSTLQYYDFLFSNYYHLLLLKFAQFLLAKKTKKLKGLKQEQKH